MNINALPDLRTQGTEPNTPLVCELKDLMSSIRDDDVFVLNPSFRLRNGKDHVVMHGAQGAGTYTLHRSTGVVVALCDGENTVSNIAAAVRPLVKHVQDDTQAVAVARSHVRAIIASFLKPKDDPVKGGFPATTPLIRIQDLVQFGKTSRGKYRARDFLPKDASEIAESPTALVHEPTPIGLTWHLTSDCATECRYCYLKRRDVRPMAKDRVLALMNEAHDMGVLAVLPGGGDPLLSPFLDEFLGAMCEYDMLADMLSTKAFVSRDKATRLAEYSAVIWSVQFSIDSTVPEVADYLTRTSGFVDRIFTSIENTLQAGLRVSAKAVITPYNVLTIPKLYRDLKSRGVDVVRLATYSRSGHHHTDDLFNHIESYGWLKTEVDKLKAAFPDDDIHMQNGDPSPSRVDLPKERKEDRWKKRNRCSAGRTSMMICSDGKVIPCEQMPETDECICGDVSHQSLQEVWDGERLKELTYGVPQARFEGQACYDCEERIDCHQKMGLCIRDLILHRGTMYHPADTCPRVDLPYVRQM